MLEWDTFYWWSHVLIPSLLRFLLASVIGNLVPCRIQGCVVPEPHGEGWNLRSQGLGKDSHWWNVQETLLRGYQSSSGDMLAGMHRCWVWGGGSVLEQRMWAACLLLQLEGELSGEKNFAWPQEVMHAASDTHENVLCDVYKLSKVILIVLWPYVVPQLMRCWKSETQRWCCAPVLGITI